MGYEHRYRAQTDEAERRVLATLLFTDLVGSTRIAATLGDRRWAFLLRAHHARVRELLAAYEGREVDDAGDGFFATFPVASAGVQCATEAAASIRELGLSVRAGLHTGECVQDGDRLRGIAVHVAARVVCRAGRKRGPRHPDRAGRGGRLRAGVRGSRIARAPGSAGSVGAVRGAGRRRPSGRSRRRPRARQPHAPTGETVGPGAQPDRSGTGERLRDRAGALPHRGPVGTSRRGEGSRARRPRGSGLRWGSRRGQAQASRNAALIEGIASTLSFVESHSRRSGRGATRATSSSNAEPTPARARWWRVSTSQRCHHENVRTPVSDRGVRRGGWSWASTSSPRRHPDPWFCRNASTAGSASVAGRTSIDLTNAAGEGAPAPSARSTPRRRRRSAPGGTARRRASTT